MRIKNIFLLIGLTGGVLTLASFWLFWDSQRRLLETTRTEQAVNKIARSGVELATALDGFLLRPSMATAKQWLDSHEHLSRHIHEMAQTNTVYAPYIGLIAFNLSNTHALHRALIDSLTPENTATKAILVSQLRLRLAELHSSIQGLDEVSDAMAMEFMGSTSHGLYFRFAILLITLLIAGFLIYALVWHRVLQPFSKLETLIKHAPTGSLTAFQKAHRDDEFGDLASAYAQALHEREQFERRSINALEQFKATFEQAAVGIAHVSPSGEWLQVNQRLCDICGYSHAEMLDRDFQEITHPDDLGADLELVQKTLAGEIPDYVLEKRYIRKDRKAIWIKLTVSLVRKPDGNPDYFVSVIEDIDARKSTESALSVAGRVANLGTWQLDIATRRALWSKEVHKILGTSTTQEVGLEYLQQVTNPADWPAVDASMQRSIQTGSTHSVEYRIERPDGGERWVFCQAYRETDSRGHPAYLNGILQDITERKHLEREVQQSRKLDALGQLTGGIAHDFNNILAGMLGFAELARSRLNILPREKLEHYLDTIIESGQHGRDLVAQMMAFSRSQPSQQQHVPLDLCQETPRIIEMLRSMLPASITIQLETEQEVPPVLMSATQYHQIVMNLCVNARDAMNGQGVLGVTIGCESVKHRECIACHRLVQGPWVAVQVSDTGCGMDTDTLSRICDPFFTTKRVGKGSGMGMSVVHGILRSIGGHILATTDVGIGTTFTLLFPAIQDKQKNPEQTDNPQSSTPKNTGHHVLIVDDEIAITNYLRELMELEGYRVTATTDSLEALQNVKGNPNGIDLIITDQTMPYLTGIQMARAVQGIRPDLPIILCSGHSELVNENNAQSFGISKFCSKPLDSKALLQAVAEQIGENSNPSTVTPR